MSRTITDSNKFVVVEWFVRKALVRLVLVDKALKHEVSKELRFSQYIHYVC